MAVAEGILKVGAQLAACEFVLPVLVNWVDCVNWELVGAAVGSSGYVFFFGLWKQRKFFLTYPYGLTWQAQHSCLLSLPFGGIRECMAGERMGEEFGGQDKGSLIGKRQKYTKHGVQFAHWTALPLPGQLCPVLISMMPCGMKYPFGQFKSAVWQCPLLAPCEPQASLVARWHKR